MQEIPLSGGRVTSGVVLVDGVVRRPRRPNARLVRSLLGLLEQTGIEIAPRYLGVDDQDREMFSYLDGGVPGELDAHFDDATVTAAARVIRRFHDATAGTLLAGEGEAVCHGDLSPCNTIFRGGTPVALIDFDNAAPGTRLEDLGYALFLWLNLGTDGPSPGEQARRIRVFCGAYGVGAGPEVVDAVRAAVAVNVERLREVGRDADVEWWRAQLRWLDEQNATLAGG